LIVAQFAVSEGHPQAVEGDDHEDARVAAVMAALGSVGQGEPGIGHQQDDREYLADSGKERPDQQVRNLDQLAEPVFGATDPAFEGERGFEDDPLMARS